MLCITDHWATAAAFSDTSAPPQGTQHNCLKHVAYLTLNIQIEFSAETCLGMSGSKAKAHILSLTHTHTHTRTHALTHTHTHTCTHTHLLHLLVQFAPLFSSLPMSTSFTSCDQSQKGTTHSVNRRRRINAGVTDCIHAITLYVCWQNSHNKDLFEREGGKAACPKQALYQRSTERAGA